MTDVGMASLVTGLITITGMIVGFLTLWAKLKYGVEKAEEAATKVKAVEDKIDENTSLTRTATTAATNAAVNAKTAVQKAQEASTEKLDILHKIEKQTNGAADAMRNLVKDLAERVEKLEDYNRDSSHRMLDAVNTMHLKIAEILALQKITQPLQAAQTAEHR